ncbi:MAG: hypothetical protein KAU62_02540 [Candidatus Heimdallarchaeota archaeon]|nr:hypothetical protein [Candidatus Heimdallarchaeota archaeon]MCK4610014.1 hypothetical protein [Candidatus Heimdallarchaeota archaeon]
MSDKLARILGEEMLQKKILELNEQLMKELDEKFIKELSEKVYDSTELKHVITGFHLYQADYIVSLLILIIHMLNKKG